jgi:hypothetical protein
MSCKAFRGTRFGSQPRTCTRKPWEDIAMDRMEAMKWVLTVCGAVAVELSQDASGTGGGERSRRACQPAGDRGRVAQPHDLEAFHQAGVAVHGELVGRGQHGYAGGDRAADTSPSRATGRRLGLGRSAFVSHLGRRRRAARPQHSVSRTKAAATGSPCATLASSMRTASIASCWCWGWPTSCS